MTDEPSYVQLVTQALYGARRPLTLDEIQVRVEMVRPVETRDPRATLRGAINSIPLAVTLGGRPAHYTWWPHHLRNNAFRQPLARSDLQAGTLVLNDEVWLALWPDFFAGPSRNPGEVILELAAGPELHTRVAHLVAGEAVWGLDANPVLVEWYRRWGAAPDDDLIVHVLDVEECRYAVGLVRHTERQEAAMAAAIAARNRALADAAEKVVRGARLDLPDFYLIPRLIAHGAYRCPLPPDPWEDVLRADRRFVIWRGGVNLVKKLVAALERGQAVPPGLWPALRRRGRGSSSGSGSG